MFKGLRVNLSLLLAFLVMMTSMVFVQPPTATAAVQATFYISPTGNDTTGNGTSGSPWKTLEKARDYIRTNYTTQTGDLIVYLKNGTYTLSNTVTFGASDSGKSGYKIIYMNDSGAAPVISGGVDITTGWTLHDGGKNIYRKTGVNWSFRQLYVNNSRAIRARVPNLTNETTGGPYFNVTNSGYPYTVNSSDIGSWANSGTAEMVLLSHWKQHRGRINNYSGTTVYFKSPESGFAYNHVPQGNPPYFFENAYELLDAEGEWFLDTANSTLYYKPRSGETMNTTQIIAPKVETLIKIEGTNASAKARDLEFSGITFKHSNWLAPSSYGYVDNQAGYRYQTVSGGSNGEIRNTARYAPVLGLVQLKYTGNVKLDHNTFQFSGGWGVIGFEGTDHTTISWNNFSKNAGGGVAMGIAGDQWDEQAVMQGQSQYDSITDNTVDGNGLDYFDMVGIGALLPQNITIARNDVKNNKYTGISVGWNWDDGDHGMINNRIYQNRIHDVMQLLDDGGGIYSLGRQDNSNYHHNYIYNLAGSPYQGGYPIAGIYFDNGSCYKTGEYNVLNNTTNAFFASNPPNHDNILQYNYYNVTWGNTGSNTVQYNTSVSGQNWPQTALDIMNAAGPGGIAPIEEINLALSATAGASSEYSISYPASNAKDGNINTIWASGTDAADPTPWLRLDFGQSYRLNKIELVARQELNQDAARRNFEVQASNAGDFSTKVVLGSQGGTAFPDKGTWSLVISDSNTYRYVRVIRTGTVDHHMNFAEFRVWSGGGSTPTPTPAPTTIPGSLFSDNFDDNILGSAWTTYGGTWSESGQVLSQTSTASGDPRKAIISNAGLGTNADYTITAKVRVDNWTDGDYARAGVGLFTGTADGKGYNLVFHNNHSTVQWLDDGVAWGTSYSFNWSNNTWYWFKVKSEAGTLYGKVWQDGTTEPSNWPYSWTRSGRTGYPALNGGSTGTGGNTASFDNLTVTGGGATPTPTPTPAAPSDYRAMWGFNNNWNDSSGNGFNMTAYGNAAFNSSDKKEGTHSATLDGSGDYGSASLVSGNTDNVTMSVWVKWGGATSTHQQILYNGNTGSNGYGLFLFKDQSDKLAILCGGNAILQSQTNLSTTAWTHLLAVRRNGTWELYVNGSQVSITNNTTAPNTPNGGTYVGANQLSLEGFKGLVDNARIYNRALSASEIAALAAQ